MTKEEYEKICHIIDDNVSHDWSTYISSSIIINTAGIIRIKEQISKLVEGEE